MARNPALNRLAPVYAGHGAGHYTLPESLLAARAASQAVLAAHAEARALLAPLDPDRIEARAVEAIFSIAESGEQVLDPEKPAAWTADLLAARTEKEQREAEARALGLAAEIASERLLLAAQDEADLVVTEHLRPALEELLAFVHSLRGRAAGLPWDQPERVIGMATPARSAWDAMTKASTRYRAIRDAQDALWRLTEADVGLSRFMEMRHLHDIWPAVGSWQQNTPPWPPDPRARLLWLVERNEQVGLWMPTPDEARLAMAETAKVLNQRLAGRPAYITGH